MKKVKAQSPPQRVMILELESKEDDVGLDVPLPQPPLQDFTPAAIATQPVSTTMMEEEEETIVLVEELDSYFLSPSVDLISSPISSHLEAMHDHFNGTFPINPVVLAHLQKSLVKVTKSANPFVASEVKETFHHLAVKLETLVFKCKVYEERRSSSRQSLNRLSNLKVEKENPRSQFLAVDVGQRTKQQQQQVVQG